MRTAALVIALAAMASLGACSQTGDNEYKVQTPHVELSTDTTTVRLPDVKLGTKTDTISARIGNEKKTIVVKQPTVEFGKHDSTVAQPSAKKP